MLYLIFVNIHWYTTTLFRPVKSTPKNAKNSQNWSKGAKIGQSQAGRGSRDNYELWNYEIVFVPVFSGDVFFIKLIRQNENFIIFHNIFFFKFLQILRNMLYTHFIFLLRECWLMLPTLLICNSQEAPNRNSYCII